MKRSNEFVTNLIRTMKRAKPAGQVKLAYAIQAFLISDVAFDAAYSGLKVSFDHWTTCKDGWIQAMSARHSETYQKDLQVAVDKMCRAWDIVTTDFENAMKV